MTKPRPGGAGAPWYRAADSVAAQNIAAGSTWTQTIDFGAGIAGLNMGDGKLYMPNTVGLVYTRRQCGEFYYTDDINDGLSVMGMYYVETLHDTVCPGHGDGGTDYDEVFEHEGYHYGTDGFLSDDQYDDTGLGDIRLKSVVLRSGRYVDLVWENTDGANAATLTVDVEVRATRSA